MAESHNYQVVYVHAKHRGPESIRLWPEDLVDRQVLGAKLRSAGVLPKGTGVRTAVGHDTHKLTVTYNSGPVYAFAHEIELRRSDLWTVIGRGLAGWHASRPGCSSSGGTLEAVNGCQRTWEFKTAVEAEAAVSDADCDEVFIAAPGRTSK